MYAILDRLMATTFIDILPAFALLLGFLVMLSSSVYVMVRVVTFLMQQTTEIGQAAYRYAGWKFPRIGKQQPTKCITVVNVGEDEFVVYLDGRFVGAEAVTVPISILSELGVGYEERRVCMRWYRDNKGKMPDYLKDITLLNEVE